MKILFRAKRIDDGEWVEGYVSKPGFTDVEGNIESYFFNAVDKLGWTSECEVSAETVCEYTGMPDKNGRKIFENDIVKGLAYSTYFIGYIVCIDAIAGFGVRYFNRHREPTAWENSSILKAIQKWKQPNEFQAEIIGNIFDNPKLLGD